jgi:uncharacterized RDD family membrane protein YckC
MTNPYAPPSATVLDVVDPDAQIVLADPGTRFGAALLDGLVMLPVALPVIVSMALDASDKRGADHSAAIIGGLVVAFLALIAWTWFTILYVSRNGQTIAKKALGIKVVRSDGTQASLGRIFLLRNVVNALFGIIPFYGVLDHVFIFGESRQCLHDKLADTIVVKA